MEVNPSHAMLQRLLLFERLLTDLSARYVDLPWDRIDLEIESGLEQIRELFGLDRCGLFKILPAEESICLTHLALGKGIAPVPKGVNLVPHFPWITSRILLDEIVSINTDEFPPEASIDRKNARELVPFHYGLHIPLTLKGDVRYMIGMTVDRSENIPGADFIPRLRLLGEIIIGTLEHVTAAQLLRESEEKYRIVADFNYDWEYWTDLDGSLKYVSPSCERISGYRPRQFLDDPALYRKIVVSEDRNIWEAHYRVSREEPKAREIQFRIRRSNGSICWIEHACQPVRGKKGELLGFRASNRDITTRKEAEIELRKAYAEIERLRKQVEADRTYLREEIKVAHDHENIIGDSDVIKYVLFRAEQIAPTDTTVLILGETGTGKELIARAIHNAGTRKERPLIKVNCAALPANLIESELFGHEKGAFTGAVVNRVGRFELADGATLFLDEIGELPLDLQPKLLRVLQDGEFERLGSSQTRRTDVRVIAATNRDMETDVQQKQFRMDLWYRLSVFTISIPPLRERSEDIEQLVNFMVTRFKKKLGKPIDSIPTDALDHLRGYAWPGNVRELENVIERAVINTSGNVLQLAEALKTGPAKKAAQQAPFIKSLAEMERAHILRALQKTNWQIHGPGGAAALLDINPSTLRGRMRKQGIQRPPHKH